MYTIAKYRFYRHLLILVVSTFALSSCKYLELYRFSQQFCDLNEYININTTDNSTNVIFNTPLLSRTLLLRYLGATPIRSRHSVNHTENNADSEDAFVSRDLFRIERKDHPNHSFNFYLHYHQLSKTPLLEQAILDPRLSRLFDPAFIRPILSSFCTDDYDIEDEYVDLRFQLKTLPHDLPYQHQLIKVFGEPDNIQNNLYRFRFAEQVEHSPDKAITFQFKFTPDKQLERLDIHYYRYDYQLDFKNGTGRLVVSR